MTKPIPEHLAHLPVHRGMPVPHAVSWSSEGQPVIRADPLVGGAAAVFYRGRQGRGRPVFGILAPDRQRRAVLLARCMVCDCDISDGGGWLPAYPNLVDGTMPGDDGKDIPVMVEPLCCEECAYWVAAGGCPHLALPGLVGSILHVTEIAPIAQLVDPGADEARKAHRFDHVSTPEELARLSRNARRFGGAVGYVKWTPLAVTTHPVPEET